MANRFTQIDFNSDADVRVINSNFNTADAAFDDVNDDIQDVANGVSAETNRASGVETQIQAAITAEMNRAQNAEQTNASGISNNANAIVALQNTVGQLQNGKLDKTTGIQTIQKVYELPANPDENTLYILTERPAFTGLKFTASGASTVAYVKDGQGTIDIDTEYSLDGGATWNSWDGTAISLSQDDVMCVKNNTTTFSPNGNTYIRFVITGTGVNISGSVMSLLSDNIIKPYCFNSLFYNCSTTFNGFELPSTELAQNCYEGIFQDCTLITKAPDLPATTLVTGCYQGMFSGCTALNEVKIGYTGNFSQDNFLFWMQFITGTGTLYYNGSDTTKGESAIPQNWTVQTF